jgi:preprotein translocase subunit SecF
MATKKQKLTIYQPMRYYLLYFVISLAFIIPGSYSLVRYGLKLGIDFTGGSSLVLKTGVISEDQFKETASEMAIDVKEITHEGDVWDLTTSPIDRVTYQNFLDNLRNNYIDLQTDSTAITELSFNTLGPSVGRELVRKTLSGIALASLLILLYVAYRFRNLKFGASAILAMFHDSLILLGTFSLLGHFQGVEVGTLFVTALLTILSFSVHDTIVVYDRIRELKKKHGYLDFEEIINRAVVETLGRSINNSMTIIFMLLAMYLMGGETTKWFIFALLVGTISGTYSSTFTAAPILLVWDKFTSRKRAK